MDSGTMDSGTTMDGAEPEAEAEAEEALDPEQPRVAKITQFDPVSSAMIQVDIDEAKLASLLQKANNFFNENKNEFEQEKIDINALVTAIADNDTSATSPFTTVRNVSSKVSNYQVVLHGMVPKTKTTPKMI